MPLQQEIETKEMTKRIIKWDGYCRRISDLEARYLLTSLWEENANDVVKQWHKLGHVLIAKYSDNYSNLPDNEEPHNIGYDSKWLALNNYKNGATSYKMKP